MRYAVIVILLVAGCLQTPELQDTEPWSALALVSGEGHDHTNASQHQGSSNFVTVGHDPMVSDHYGQTAGGYLCGDARDFGDKRLAIVESRTDVAFAIMNVTDPLQPEWLGEMVFPGTRVYDVALLPDGEHAVIVTQQAAVPVWQFRDRCGSVELPLPPLGQSIIVIDLEALEIVQELPLLGWGHSVMSYDHQGTAIVMATSLGPDIANSWVHFYVFDAASLLVPVNAYRASDAAGMTSNVWHDGWIEERDNTLYAHIVGGHNYEILDIDDISRFNRVTQWRDAVDGWGWTGNLHGVLPYQDPVTERHYAIIGPEWGDHPEDHPSGVIRVLDIEEMANPVEVAAWTLPHDVAWDGFYMFSNHYYTVQGDTMFVSMYHGGIWAVDLAPIRDGTYLLPSVGVYLPSTEGVEAAVPIRWAPTTQEIFAFDDDTLLTFDSNTGTYAFQYTGPLPAPTPWPIEPIPEA